MPRRECNSRGDGGFIVGKAARGARYPIRWDASRFDSDEMSPLYENRYLTVDLVQIRLRQSSAR
jgi:hypothetical protein